MRVVAEVDRHLAGGESRTEPGVRPELGHQGGADLAHHLHLARGPGAALVPWLARTLVSDLHDDPDLGSCVRRGDHASGNGLNGDHVDRFSVVVHSVAAPGEQQLGLERSQVTVGELGRLMGHDALPSPELSSRVSAS